jgi:purine-binding chemotaxis protein CheW
MNPQDPLDRGAAEILSRRAARLRAAPTDEGQEDFVWLAEVSLRDELFALPLSSLRAAIPLRGVCAVPLVPPHVVGIVRYQGQVIAAYSLAALLGVRGWKRDPNVLIVVEHAPNKLSAIDSELIPEAVAVPRMLVERARAQAPGAARIPFQAPGLPLRTLLDVARLLGSAAAPAAAARSTLPPAWS